MFYVGWRLTGDGSKPKYIMCRKMNSDLEVLLKFSTVRQEHIILSNLKKVDMHLREVYADRGQTCVF